MGFHHSSYNGDDYGDRTGMMGYSFSEDEGPEMCFNAAKSWQSGWYFGQGKTRTMPIGGNSGVNDCFKGRVSGIADYEITSNHVLIKIVNPDKSGDDLFVTLNAKKGINRETQEAGNQVTVTLAPDGGEEFAISELLATLSQGSSYKHKDWKKELIIKVGSIVTNSDSASYAEIEISYDGVDECTVTPEPTSNVSLLYPLCTICSASTS